MGGGIGAALYERVREEARALGTQLYFESLPDDPALSPNPEVRAGNAARLKFYERYGARPLRRVIESEIVSPLSEFIAAGVLAEGDVVEVLVDDAEEGRLGFVRGARETIAVVA